MFSIADMIVEATFVNPYADSTNSWDYGFFVRNDTWLGLMRASFLTNLSFQATERLGSEGCRFYVSPYDRIGRRNTR